MKSIKQQYIDLKEGKMTQSNFMRNVRMTLPQYVTNVTSFKDTVQILKNKAILTEADIKENIHNTAQMGGIFSNHQAEDKAALDKIDELIKNGLPPDKAIEKIANEDNYRLPYLTNLYNNSKGIEELDVHNIAGDPEAEADALKNIQSIKPHEELDSKIKNIETQIGDIEERIYNKYGDDELEKFDYDKAINDIKLKYNNDKNKLEYYSSLKYHLEKLKNEFPKAKSLNEAKEIKGSSGKEEYSKFSEINNANSQEILIGIDYERVKNCKLNKTEAAKIAIKNIKKVPNYYTNYKLTGIRDFKPETMGNVNPDDRKMKPYAADKVIDKAMGMKPIKGVEKIKASANKAHKETNELVKGVQELTHKSKRAKGIKGTMDMTGGKMKKVKIKESYGDFVAQKKAEETAAELAAETHNGFRRGDKVNVDPEAAHSLGLDPNKTYTIEDFQLSGKGLFKSVDAILDKKAYIKTIYSTTPDGSVSVKYLIKAEDTLKERLASIVRKELIEALGIGGGDNMLDVDGFMMDTSTNDELFEAKASSLAVGEKFKMSGDLGKFVTGEEVTVVSIKPYGNDLQIVLSNGKDKDDFYVDKNDEL